MRTSMLLSYAFWWQGNPEYPRIFVCLRAQTGHLRSLLPYIIWFCRHNIIFSVCQFPGFSSTTQESPSCLGCQDHSNTHLTCMVANSDSQLTSESVVSSRRFKLNISAIHQPVNTSVSGFVLFLSSQWQVMSTMFLAPVNLHNLLITLWGRC